MAHNCSLGRWRFQIQGGGHLAGKDGLLGPRWRIVFTTHAGSITMVLSGPVQISEHLTYKNRNLKDITNKNIIILYFLYKYVKFVLYLIKFRLGLGINLYIFMYVFVSMILNLVWIMLNSGWIVGITPHRRSNLQLVFWMFGDIFW